MTGIYYRVKRNEKWCDIEIEHLTQEEIFEILKDRETPELIRIIEVLCGNLRYVEENEE